MQDASAAAGWRALLELRFERQGEGTILGPCTRRGPLTLQRPFYPEASSCHVYLLHPPGGVASGDELYIGCELGDGAHALLTTPGAAKFYRSNGRPALQRQHLKVENQGTLEWLPQETILFENAEAQLTTLIDLAEDARLAWWEIVCLGRPANHIDFEQGSLDMRLAIERQGQPLLVERTRITPESRHFAAGLRGHAVFGTAVFSGAGEAQLEACREVLNIHQPHECNATLLDDMLVLRYLGDSSERARRVFASIWGALRPSLIGLPACTPRIWLT